MDEQIIEVLKDIRSEARGTNARLESREGRVASLESTTTTHFESLETRIDEVGRRQVDSELRLATEVLSLADVTRDVRDLLARKLHDHAAVVNHEERIRALEDRDADKDDEP